jgi:hypothetical protein
MTKAWFEKLDCLGFDFTPRKHESGLKVAIFPAGYGAGCDNGDDAEGAGN